MVMNKTFSDRQSARVMSAASRRPWISLLTNGPVRPFGSSMARD